MKSSLKSGNFSGDERKENDFMKLSPTQGRKRREGGRDTKDINVGEMEEEE